jgi:iron complex transport system substrate-binding protein
MSRVTLWNVGGLALAVALSSAPLWSTAFHGLVTHAPQPTAADTGARVLVDHSGNSVTAGHYVRIVSLSTVADELLLELCEPDRIVAFTEYTAHNSAESYRYAGKTTLEGARDLEKILTLRPDLVLVNPIGDARPIARIREAGLVVYDLGEMRGMKTLLPNVREIAALVGHPERGDAFARTLTARMEAVAADVAPASRKRGLYLSVYGGHMYGGSAGTSYHDVLVAGGLLEAAARYRDWQEYSVEQLLTMDPDVIVTHAGMRPRICEHSGLESLRACRVQGGVAEIDDSLLGDPGPVMLDAAAAVHAAVYGAQPTEVTTTGRGP